MKKLLLLSMLAVTFQLVNAQDIKKVQTSVLLGRIEDAKTEIDKVMADPKQNTKPEALYWKAKIYAAVYKDIPLRTKYPNAVNDANEAFKSYAAADPAFAQVKDKGAEPYFDMYSTSFGLGVKDFNDKKWEAAAAYFEQSIVYIDQIIKNKWTSGSIAFDTTSLLYAGYALQNANKPAEASKFYGRLAEGKVGGPNYIDVYKFLAIHYINTKNEAQFKKYLALAKEVYPKDTWDDYETDYMDKNYTLDRKKEIYDEQDKAGKLKETQYLQFGDLFVHAKDKDKSNQLDSAQLAYYSLKAIDAFKKAYAANNQNAIAAFNVGVIYYNIFGEYDDKYAGNIHSMQALNANKPVEKDPKKKAAAEAKFKQDADVYRKANAELEKPLMGNIDLAIDWIEKSFKILKDKADRNAVEKNVISKEVDFLANLYTYKRDKARSKDPKAFDLYDAKFKEFDALHGKY